MAIGALVPAAVMSIGAANLFTRNVYRDFIRPDATPSEAELRVAQAQLVGWLEGLFHGIQTTLFAQQMAARAQLEQMRRALPPGLLPAEQDQQPHSGSGPYL